MIAQFCALVPFALLLSGGCSGADDDRPTDLQVIEACLAEAREQRPAIDADATAWVGSNAAVSFDRKLLVARWPAPGATDLPFTCEYRFGRETPEASVTFSGSR